MDPYVILTCRTQEQRSSVASGTFLAIFYAALLDYIFGLEQCSTGVYNIWHIVNSVILSKVKQLSVTSLVHFQHALCSSRLFTIFVFKQILCILYLLQLINGTCMQVKDLNHNGMRASFSQSVMVLQNIWR